LTFKEITVSNNSISIPEGYIVDYIDSKFRKDTPEEYVRQNIEKRLVNEHRYLHKQIKIEMPIKMGSQKPRVDIAIFKNELEDKQEQIYMIVECKSESIEPTNRKEGVEQLKSYMTACLNCEWGMWTNGKVKTALKKTRQQKGELLFDLISHDIGNYHQTIQGSLDIITSLFKKNNNDNNPNALSQNNERIFLFLTTAKKALTKSQSLVDNIRRLERLYTQKDLKLTLKNLPDAINNAYTTVDQTLYDTNPQGKRIRFSIKVVNGYCTTDINVIAEDLLEEIFVNLFSNSVKYTESSEVKIDVLIREYFIGEVKYWMITVSDYGKGIPDLMKKELFERFYSKAKGSGLGLSIVRTLVERYRGKVWIGDRVYEDYSKGTTFGMIFPAAEQ